VSCWYAAYTKSRHEKVVRSGLEGLGFEVFLPIVRKLRHWSDRKKLVGTPLFPSYVFVRCAQEERVRAYGLKGLVRFVTSGNRPVPVPPSEIEAIREVLSRDVPFDPHPKLQSGHAVRVVAGPLRGITGRLVRRGRHCRLLLAISALGQAVSVEVDATDVEPD
jgi:transcription antitermination factor NusG